MSDARTINVSTHGRYLVAGSQAPGARVLVGFHGYAESAEIALERLRAAADAQDTLVAIQGLHRFYRGRTQEVIASWMTSQDRDLMIADNIAYVDAVLDAVRGGRRESGAIVYAGFSQGVAMAFRAACLGAHQAAAIVTLGGDVPPELDAERLRRVPAVLIGRNQDDAWYADGKFDQDQRRLREAGMPVTPVVVAGGHEWTDAFSDAVREFLTTLR